MGSPVLQPQGTDFCQEPMNLEEALKPQRKSQAGEIPQRGASEPSADSTSMRTGKFKVDVALGLCMGGSY